ncbi:MAG TPA: sensor domain-containing diguanylate cyclase [Gaiellaceae bacterium]|nr:sensor domain-containing diguanylate cyclase [Gaiellaceae bacterium]
MTTALVALGSASVTLGLVIVVMLLVRRGRPEATAAESSTEVALAVRDLNARMDGLVRELTEALERSSETDRRNKHFGELAGSIDLDEVLTRVLEAAGATPGADAALVTIAGTGGLSKPIVATLGLSADEAERQAVAGPPDGRQVRSVAISYDYPEPANGDADSPGADPIRAGLAVPLPGEASTIGMLTVFTRSSSRTFSRDDRRDLEELAERAGPAIDNARRFREARQLADLDALTGLHNRRYFHDTLAREVARAHRYDRRLALIIFDLDDFKAINDRIGHLSGDAVLADAADVISSVVRSADIACRVGGDEFAVILPESGMQEAEQLYARLQQELAQRPLADAGRIRLSAGVAELARDDDSRSFFERADDALYSAKEAGKGRAVAAEGSA